MPTIFDIKRFAIHDGPGIRTTVFFKGCPLNCPWCHNPESFSPQPESCREVRIVDGKEIPFKKTYGREIGHDALIHEILKDRLFFEESEGGVTLSGGEPLMQFDALLRLLEELGTHGIHRAVDTSGYAPAGQLMAVAAHTDLFLYDLKLMDPDRYRELTGVDNLLILQNADMLLDQAAELLFRVPLVPGVNDREEEIAALLEFLSARKGRFSGVSLLPYHRTGMDKYRRLEREYTLNDTEVPAEEFINALKEKIEAEGIAVNVGG
jgi:pyruvate formate lyase activating enzyme